MYVSEMYGCVDRAVRNHHTLQQHLLKFAHTAMTVAPDTGTSKEGCIFLDSFFYITWCVIFWIYFPCFPVANRELKQSHYQLDPIILGTDIFRCPCPCHVHLLPSAVMSLPTQLFFRANCPNSTKNLDWTWRS